MIKLSVGERISELRKEQHISQAELAQALEVTRQAVSKWENDLSSPDCLNLIKLAQVLDSEVEYIASGRRSYGRRPPVVLETIKTVEKVVEKPVVQVVEKRIEVEKPVVQYVEKPVIRKVIRTKYQRNPYEYAIVGLLGFAAGILLGLIL